MNMEDRRMNQRVAFLLAASLLVVACGGQSPGQTATSAAAATGASSPTPTAIPSPSSLVPSAQASPSGGVAYVGDTFVISLPHPWTVESPPANEGDRIVFVGPGIARLYELTTDAAAGLTLTQLTTNVIASVKKQSGASAERQEAITIDGVAATLLTTHYTMQGISVDHLEAVCIRHGLVYDFYYANYRGAEAQDRAFFLAAIATVIFIAQ
jgi:hypothetical protein